MSRNTVRYASDQLVLSKNQGLVDDSDSVSSCGTSSGDDSSTPLPKLRRLKYTIPPIDANFVLDPSSIIVVPHKSNKDKSIVIVPKFFSETRISKLRAIFQTSPSMYEIKDRKENLLYAHTAYRVEIPLRLESRKTYLRIMKETCRICDYVWGNIRDKARKNRVIPELEYIVYDVPEGTEPAFIEPHVDNHSIVTGVAMLSEPDVDFCGGVNRFKGAQSEDSETDFREWKLGKGDLVLFRGETVTHWITPVAKGRREILQWEFSRI